ncbi:hypothetical protein ACP4OV_014628 [Aristida adscensionis]
MKLLQRLALGGFDRFGRLARRRAIGLRSIHVLPCGGHTETPANPAAASSASSPATAAAAAGVGPRWTMLSQHGRRSDSVAGSRTMAQSWTSTGRPFRVSADIAAPPASSFLLYDWAGGAPGDGENDDDGGLQVIAAHGDTVLFELEHGRRGYSRRSGTYDNFVYRAGAGERRPPSLSPLPTSQPQEERMEFNSISTGLLRRGKERDGGLKALAVQGDSVLAFVYRAGGVAGDALRRALSRLPASRPQERLAFDSSTGLLRRGEDELLLIQLELTSESDTAKLRVLGIGSREWLPQWETKEAVPIIVDDEGAVGDGGEWLLWPEPDAAVPVGDRFMCWVNYLSCVLVCDMAAAAAEGSPTIRCVPLPVAPPPRKRSRYDDGPEAEYYRNMCAAAGGAVRLVSVDPRCCCGGPGTSTCSRSASAFTVTTWTLRLGGAMDDGEEPMAWVKDGVLDCEELWAQPGYEGLSRAQPWCPVVSSDNPDVVCFKVAGKRSGGGRREDWMIEVDTRRKALLSVVPCTDGGEETHLQAKLHC